MERKLPQVRQRFKDYWLPIPYIDSFLADINEPEMWQEIDFPENFTGYSRMIIHGQLLTMDEYEEKHPIEFQEFVDLQIEYFKKTSK